MTNETKAKFILGSIAIAIFLALVFSTMGFDWVTGKTVTITVVKTEAIPFRAGVKYLVFTKKGMVYENVDAWAYLKFNSSDLHAKIKVGETYDAFVCGWRWAFFSWYRNIISVKRPKGMTT